MSKHTPGPWFSDDIGDMDDIYRYIVADLTAQGADCVVAKFDLPNPIHAARRQQAEANARLMAAAPDLLAALQALVAELDGSGKPDSSDSYAPEHFVTADKAAIAKATIRRATLPFGGAKHGETK